MVDLLDFNDTGRIIVDKIPDVQVTNLIFGKYRMSAFDDLTYLVSAHSDFMYAWYFVSSDRLPRFTTSKLEKNGVSLYLKIIDTFGMVYFPRLMVPNQVALTNLITIGQDSYKFKNKSPVLFVTTEDGSKSGFIQASHINIMGHKNIKLVKHKLGFHHFTTTKGS